MSRRSVPHFESCEKIISARAADNGTNEEEWLPQAADLLKDGQLHPVETVFHNGAAYDLRMQRAVRVAWCGGHVVR